MLVNASTLDNPILDDIVGMVSLQNGFSGVTQWRGEERRGDDSSGWDSIV